MTLLSFVQKLDHAKTDDMKRLKKKPTILFLRPSILLSLKTHNTRSGLLAHIFGEPIKQSKEKSRGLGMRIGYLWGAAAYLRFEKGLASSYKKMTK